MCAGKMEELHHYSVSLSQSAKLPVGRMHPLDRTVQ
jgi:hypothetical protein